jgi:hypothetical protein
LETVALAVSEAQVELAVDSTADEAAAVALTDGLILQTAPSPRFLITFFWPGLPTADRRVILNLPAWASVKARA